MKVLLKFAITLTTVLTLATISASAQQERGVLQGWLQFWDAFDTGTDGTGVAIYDLTRADYDVLLTNLDPHESYFVYLVEHRPPMLVGLEMDWSAWGGVETGAAAGDDDKFLFLGEVITNARGDGLISVSLGAGSARMVRRFNMIFVFDERRAPGQSLTTALLGCNGEFYGVGPGMEYEVRPEGGM